MAKKSNKPFPPIEFIVYRLNDTQKQDFLTWEKQTSDDMLSMLISLVDMGHKVSVSYDNHNKSYIAAVTCKDEDSPNHGCCLTSRGGDIERVYMLAIYKTLVLLPDLPWLSAEPAEDWG